MASTSSEARPGEGAAGAATRARLTAAAGRCIRKYGIAKTGVGDIVRAAGASRQTAYHYFKNRQELIRSALIDEAARFIARIPDAVAHVSEPVDVLLEIATFLFREVPKDEVLSALFSPGALASLEPVADAPDTLQLAKAVWTPYAEAVGGVDDEELAALAELMTRLIFSAMLDSEKDALLRGDDQARAKLRLWFEPMVAHHLRAKKRKPSRGRRGETARARAQTRSKRGV